MFKNSQSFSLVGDCLSLLPTFPTGVFDACIADPPYNMSKKRGLAWAFSKHVTMQESWDRFTSEEYVAFCELWLREICRVVKPNGNIFVFGTYHNIYQLGFLIQQMQLKILNSIIWVKPNAQPNITCRMLTESSEQLIWACNNHHEKASKWHFDYRKAKEICGGKQMRNVWEFPLTPRRERVANHPTQKPEQLIRRILSIATASGHWVLDPFAGVGTTGIVAAQEGRNFVMVEKDAHYVAAQKTRFLSAGLSSSVEFAKELPTRFFRDKKPDDTTRIAV